MINQSEVPEGRGKAPLQKVVGSLELKEGSEVCRWLWCLICIDLSEIPGVRYHHIIHPKSSPKKQHPVLAHAGPRARNLTSAQTVMGLAPAIVF